MKILTQLVFTILLVFLFTLDSDAQRPKTQVVFADSTFSFTYPVDVANIIGNKCYGCHSPGSRNKKAREKLVWLDLQAMSPVDLVGILGDMHEVLEEGSMPPKKMLERFPGAKLSDEEVATLKAWVDKSQSKLMDE